MDIDQLNINAVCFGILCNFAPVCGEERAKEAVELIRALQAENAKLHAEIEKEMKRRKTQADIIQTERGQKYEMMEKMNQIIKTMHGDCNYCLNQHSGLDGPCKGCVFSTKREFIDGDYWECRDPVEG